MGLDHHFWSDEILSTSQRREDGEWGAREEKLELRVYAFMSRTLELLGPELIRSNPKAAPDE